MWKWALRREHLSEEEHLSKDRKGLAVRYTIDRDEAERRDALAAEAAAREADEQPGRPPLDELDQQIAELVREYQGGSVEPAESAPEHQPRLAPRFEAPDATSVPAVARRPVDSPLASFSLRQRHLLLLGFTAVAAVCYATNWQSPVRVAVMVVFFLFVPGLALSELAPPADGPERLVVGIGASLALETLVAVAFLYAGFFTPGRVIGVFLLTTAGLTAVAALRTPQAS